MNLFFKNYVVNIHRFSEKYEKKSILFHDTPLPLFCRFLIIFALSEEKHHL